MSELPVSFDEQGLVPVVVQDNTTGDVLMLAFMNTESLGKTRETGRMHYWSRSRQSLWKKGETSGNEQIVKSIHVNCYNNSLLFKVEQLGACCHTGFPTCYYRELEPDDTLTTHGTPLFNPQEVYAPTESLRADLTLWIGAYRFLADSDQSAVSGTSRLLQEAFPEYLATRITDELRELLGVLTGEHRHVSVDEDLALESTQVLYWTALTAIRAGASDDELVHFLDQGMLTGTSLPSGQLPDRIRQLAADWGQPLDDLSTLVQRTGGVVSAAATAGGTSAHRLIIGDLDDLRTKPYLTRHFVART